MFEIRKIFEFSFEDDELLRKRLRLFSIILFMVTLLIFFLVAYLINPILMYSLFDYQIPKALLGIVYYFFIGNANEILRALFLILFNSGESIEYDFFITLDAFSPESKYTTFQYKTILLAPTVIVFIILTMFYKLNFFPLLDYAIMLGIQVMLSDDNFYYLSLINEKAPKKACIQETDEGFVVYENFDH